MKIRPGIAVALTLLLSVLLTPGCSDAGEPATGELEGVVEQVVHSGVMPSEDETPTRTITPVAGVAVTITDEDGEVSMALTTDMVGRFRARLPAGTYTVSIPPREEEGPGSGTESRNVTILGDSLVEVTLRYSIYTP